ncbi:zinc-regulated transporter 1 [Aspergillus udagawae]|uniref:Zinc-regulated transporter 1 n=1 Tax=Aspergillus udagawae TaxID=91492 RepID=A0A8H3P5I2_9EURO|nr:zinc-regulated transporter 1 [Aspergillus udagawae]
MSPECNDYSWVYWSWTEQPRLTQALRKEQNDKSRKVNEVIKAAARDLETMGVMHVEGLQDAYKGHRYCEAGATKEQTEYKAPATPDGWTGDDEGFLRSGAMAMDCLTCSGLGFGAQNVGWDGWENSTSTGSQMEE